MSLLVLAIGFLALSMLSLAEAQFKLRNSNLVASVLTIRWLVALLFSAILFIDPISPWIAAPLLVVIFYFVPQFLGARFSTTNLASNLSERLSKILAKLTIALQVFEPKRESPEVIEQELLESVEDFSETVVREVMVPRVDIETIGGDDTLESALAQFIATGFSRLPVTGKSVDDVLGIIYLKDVARIAHEDPERLQAELVIEFSRPAYFVPESRAVAELLREMQQNGIQLVVVSDEYGGVAGIATFEDLIEELVGEISDENDRPTEEIQIISPERIRVSPRLSLEELGEAFAIEINETEVETVGGWFTKLLGHLPVGGESVIGSGLRLEAERVDSRRNRIVSILVQRETTE